MDNYIEDVFSARLVFKDILKALHRTAKTIPTLIDSPSVDEAFQTLVVRNMTFRGRLLEAIKLRLETRLE